MVWFRCVESSSHKQVDNWQDSLWPLFLGCFNVSKTETVLSWVYAPRAGQPAISFHKECSRNTISKQLIYYWTSVYLPACMYKILFATQYTIASSVHPPSCMYNTILSRLFLQLLQALYIMLYDRCYDNIHNLHTFCYNVACQWSVLHLVQHLVQHKSIHAWYARDHQVIMK